MNRRNFLKLIPANKGDSISLQSASGEMWSLWVSDNGNLTITKPLYIKRLCVGGAPGGGIMPSGKFVPYSEMVTT